MSLKHVVVGGGTGWIGSCLISALQNQGVKTTIISRMPGPCRISWHDLEKKGLPEDVSDVINVAGQNILDVTRRWTPGYKQNICNSRIETTKALAKAVSSTDAKSFVTISGVAYYPTDGKEYTEEDKCEPYDFLSKLCHDWEAAAKLPDDCKIRQVTIRSGVVLGRTGGMIQQIFPPFFMGAGGIMGTGKQYMPWIHIRDLVRLFQHAMCNENLHGVLNGVAPQIITNHEFTKAFAEALWRPSFLPMPTAVVNLLFGEERAKIVLEGQKVIPKKVLESDFKYNFPDIQSACKKFAQLNYSDT
ncbi:epimerase family protein SDR39U1 isoform X1 [Leptopilina heterotoma]|uniref:epimerase family protein SDR39U1 isoform X1 n=2 Tax=Leptopilina heterotoma TaxID=63436 RepID=UPI001CA8E4CE|nr:epimerase family protein SDR39U1 isoform X1 [Leptopilina heterotoma]